MIAILLVYLPWILVKHRKAPNSGIEYATAPLLSYGLFISVCSFAVFVVLFAVFMFTATREPTATHSFAVKSVGGDILYTYPALAISWMSILFLTGIIGIANLVMFCLYRSDGKLNRIKLPIIGRVDID
jgi:hypothetical protein